MSPAQRSPGARARHVWSLGSYPDIAPTLLPMAGHLVDGAGVDSDDTVLDVGCGTGNVAITAARRGAEVTGIDIVPAMIEDARENAAIAGIENVSWQEGDATALPFADDSFDVTLSSVAHVFAEPPETAARELYRVTRPDGRIAFTSWTPSSVVAAMGAVLFEYLPPDPEAPDPPFLWGDPDVVRDRLEAGARDIESATGTVQAPVLSPAHYWEQATTESGLFIVALERIDDADRPALREAMIRTIEQYFDDDRNVVRMEYRLATATAT